jgi:hypothetical protein
MRAATFFSYLFFFFSFFALAIAVPVEPDNGGAVAARADLTGEFDKVLDARDTGKEANSTDSVEGKTFGKDDNGRALCSWPWMYCSNTRVCCPLGGDCCTNSRCCNPG